MYVNIYTYVHIFVHIFVHIYTFIYTCIYIYIYVYVCIHICIHIAIYVYTHKHDSWLWQMCHDLCLIQICHTVWLIQICHNAWQIQMLRCHYDGGSGHCSKVKRLIGKCIGTQKRWSSRFWMPRVGCEKRSIFLPNNITTRQPFCLSFFLSWLANTLLNHAHVDQHQHVRG